MGESRPLNLRSKDTKALTVGALLPIITIEELHRLVLIFERLAAVIN
jgi:hypothetical protein